MLLTLSWPVKFSKRVVSVWNFVQSLYYKTISVSRCESLEIRLIRRKRWNTLSVFHVIFLNYSNDQGRQTRPHLTSFWLKLCGAKCRITRHYSAELQTATQPLRATKYSIESTYSDLPCHLKVNRGNVPVKSKLKHPPGHTLGIWRLLLPGREEIWWP